MPISARFTDRVEKRINQAKDAKAAVKEKVGERVEMRKEQIATAKAAVKETFSGNKADEDVVVEATPDVEQAVAAEKVQALTRGRQARKAVQERVQKGKEQAAAAVKGHIKEKVSGKSTDASDADPKAGEELATEVEDEEEGLPELEPDAPKSVGVVIFLNLIVVNAEAVAKEKIEETVTAKIASKAPPFLPAARGKGLARLAGKGAGLVAARKVAGTISSKIGEQLAAEVPAMVGANAGATMDAAVVLELGPSKAGARLVVLKVSLHGMDMLRLLQGKGEKVQAAGARALQCIGPDARFAAETALCRKVAKMLAIKLEQRIPAQLYEKAGLEVHLDACPPAKQAATLLEIMNEFAFPGVPPAEAAATGAAATPPPFAAMGEALEQALHVRGLAGVGAAALALPFDAARDAEPETEPAKVACVNLLRGIASNLMQAFVLSTLTGCAQPLFAIGRNVTAKVAKSRAAKQVAAAYGGFALRIEAVRAAGRAGLC